jgi:hypothetical protein
MGACRCHGPGTNASIAPAGCLPGGDALARLTTLICEMERPVGSNIPRRVCRTPEQIEREREAAQTKMREISRPGAKDANY